VSGTQATLTLAEGAVDTAASGMTLALAANAAGVRDTLGNQSSFAATAVVDKAAPALVSASSGGGTSNLMQAGDTMDLVFSETLAAGSVPSSVTVTESRSGGSTLAIATGIIQNASIANSYLSGNGASGSAPGTVTLTNGGKTIHIVLGTLTQTGGTVATGSGGATLSAAATITDLAANGAATASSALCSPLF
jgi:hypothetical protein